MKVQICDVKNSKVGEIDLPDQFSEEVRTDLISRAVLAVQANNRQRYGASPMAGMRHSVDIQKRRRDYKASYGRGISRIPRKTLSRNGTQFFFVGAQAPGTRGGRQAHPPKATKFWSVKINDAERKKAIRSALAACADAKIVSVRGHKIPQSYPIVLGDDFEKIAKTKDFVAALESLGFEAELERSSVKRIRAGKGTMRGRKYQRTVGPLVVVSSACEATKAARNIPGVDVVCVSSLNAENLAPGCVPGRATLFTKKALEVMKESKLFL